MRPLVAMCAALAVAASACLVSSEGRFGADLYEQSCSACHRSDGNGAANWPPIGAGSNSVLLTDDQIAGVIRAGAGVMPSYPRLTDAQVESLVVYVRRLQAAG